MTLPVRTILRKLLALAVLFGLVAIVTGGVLVPIIAKYQTVNEDIEVQRALLGRYLSSVSQKSGQTDRDVASADLTFLAGETDALRLANLQSTLYDAARAQNIRLTSTRAMEAGDNDGVRLLGVQAQFSTELDQLQRLLFTLEQQQASLIVDSLHIARGPDGGAMPLPSLDVTFVLLGAAPVKKE